MTRTAVNLNRRMMARRIAEPDLDWFFYTVLGVGPGGMGIYTSDVLPEGTVIRQIRFEVQPLAVVDHLHDLDLVVALSDQDDPPQAQFTTLERIIEFDIGKGNDWVPVLQSQSVEYPCRKTIYGANKRIALLVRNGTLIQLDLRVGVFYTRA